MKRWIVVIVILLSGCAHQDEWTSRDTVFELTYIALSIADASTTARIRKTDGIQEVGPVARQFLGAQPQESDIWMYYGVLTISHYFISRALPAKWRPYWQGITILDEAYWVVNNCNLGLC